LQGDKAKLPSPSSLSRRGKTWWGMGGFRSWSPQLRCEISTKESLLSLLDLRGKTSGKNRGAQARPCFGKFFLDKKNRGCGRSGVLMAESRQAEGNEGLVRHEAPRMARSRENEKKRKKGLTKKGSGPIQDQVFSPKSPEKEDSATTHRRHFERAFGRKLAGSAHFTRERRIVYA